jgi:hypothetical protein
VPKFDFHLKLTRRVWALAAMALVTMALGTGVALYRFNSSAMELRRAELRSEVEIAADWLKAPSRRIPPTRRRRSAPRWSD